MTSLNVDLGRNAHIVLVNQYKHSNAFATSAPNSDLGFPAILQGGTEKGQALGGKRYFLLCAWTLICWGNTSYLRSQEILEQRWGTF